ncbi:DNA-binding transcription factor yap1 [Linnemannia hyalina]|uniref:DNA-binding transcription factor yap1 n=1 Tax=Linnemannia hyalina TaxID=64524 RepID=A0A9P8BMS7_9FUNG|nr:DNA-binding transcription factor yap1 [Linnemannia hyalina]
MSLEQHHANSYSNFLGDKDWAQILSNNPEAQDLLSTAIAHHDQYREEDPMKRKGNLSHLQSSISYANSNQEVHNSDGDNSSDEGHSPGEGKPAPKKAGRKPLTTEPTNKRKAQNRAAQRAFRDRKERYVKSLEDRIKELEELNPGKTDTKLAEENLNLKVLVQKLETENYFLKEQAFTFDFPIAQPGLYNLAKGANGSSSEQSSPSPVSQPINNLTPTATTAATKKAAPTKKPSFTSTNVAKPPTYDQLPWSPPSSIGDSVPNSPLENAESTPEPESTTPRTTYVDNAGIVPGVNKNTHTSTASARDLALFSSLLDGAGNTYSVVPNLGPNTTTASSLSAYSPSTVASHPSPASTLIATSQHSPSPTIDDLVNSTPLFDAHGNITFTPTTTNLGLPSLTYEQTQALFTDFRDTSDSHDFFPTFEDSVDAAAFPPEAIGGLFNDQLFNYTNSFANVAATPAREESQEFFGKVTESTNKSLPPLDDNERALPCPEVWEHIAKHPNFDDADIDDLCAEMKSKAKCSGHGPVIPVKEVTNIMNRMTQQ